MILAFKLSNLVTVPFGWLLGQLYHLTNNYGIAMIIFALFVQGVMVPMRAKAKKSTMKISRLQPRIQEIQNRYASDPQKMNEVMQNLYQEEGVSMGGSCLWSLIPLFILFPLFTVIREPITYILGESAEVTAQIIEVIKANAPTLFDSARGGYYDQVIAAGAISQYASELSSAIPGIAAETLEGINFNFLGINLGNIPDWKFWTWEAINWAHIGAALIPLMSAGSQMLQMWIAQKMNDSLVTDKNGIQDKETAKNSQAAQQTQMMMWMMPIMSLWIGFTVPTALSLYWFAQGIIAIVQDVILTKHYRKIYDAEDAARLAKHMEAEAIEAEKERVRAERRAANPEGITANTSKKKMQQAKQKEEEAAKAAAAKEYAAKKGLAVEEEKEEKTTLSGIAERPYCKGRAYDPNRYSNTEE